MKSAKIIALILVVAAVFSGCSLRISSSMDDLISPISPFGDNADIKSAMDEFAGSGYSLKTPHLGSYITAYNFFDLDGDKSDEAIVFYEPSDNLGTINMALIKKVDDKWRVIDNKKGIGVDVSSLSFEDVDGDGRYEIIVCWDTISNSTNHELAMYDYRKESNKLHCFYKGLTVNNYIAVDMVNDSTPELLMFELNSGDYSTAKAELYSFTSKKARLISETKLDAHITSYNRIQVETVKGENRVFADAIGSNGSSMLTEIIRWSSGYNAIVSPYYSYSSGRTPDTTRSIMITSRDINGDGRIEVPFNDSSVKKLPKAVSCVRWKFYDDGPMAHACYSLMPKGDGYLVIIPDDYISKIDVAYNQEQKLMTVISKKDKKEVFSVRPVLKVKYSKSKYKDYELMFEKKGYYFLAKTGDSGAIKIPLDELKKQVLSIEQD
ncbi:MAG: hypothetical protein IJR60_00650 [Eubacterium sp.]|nr:hypothetical protein [Eubacterium sp.]